MSYFWISVKVPKLGINDENRGCTNIGNLFFFFFFLEGTLEGTSLKIFLDSFYFILKAPLGIYNLKLFFYSFFFPLRVHFGSYLFEKKIKLTLIFLEGILGVIVWGFCFCFLCLRVHLGGFFQTFLDHFY